MEQKNKAFKKLSREEEQDLEKTIKELDLDDSSDE